MKITKHQPGEDGRIIVNHSVRLITMGLQNNIVTVWSLTDTVGKQGIPLRFHVKKDGDPVTIQEAQRYITSFISNEGDGVFHLFGEESKIALPQHGPVNPPQEQGPKRDPGGGQILT